MKKHARGLYIIRHVSYRFGKNISSALGSKNLKIPAYHDLVKVRRYIFNRSQGDLLKKGHSPRCPGNHDQVETVEERCCALRLSGTLISRENRTVPRLSSARDSIEHLPDSRGVIIPAPACLLTYSKGK